MFINDEGQSESGWIRAAAVSDTQVLMDLQVTGDPQPIRPRFLLLQRSQQSQRASPQPEKDVRPWNEKVCNSEKGL